MTWNMVHFDVQLIGGMVLASRRDRGNGDGRRQDAGGDPAALSQRAHRPRRASRDGERLPRPPRRGMDGRALHVSSGSPSAASSTIRPPDLRREQYAATSPTARTRSSASITCATTAWPRRKDAAGAARLSLTRSSTKSTRILIDEARTPLIISGPGDGLTHQYDKFKPLVEQLVHKQNMLCNRWPAKRRKLFDKGEIEEAGRLHVQGQDSASRATSSCCA